MKKVTYTQACEVNNIDLSFVNFTFNDDRGPGSNQPLATCRATFKNGLELRDIAIWESRKTGEPYVSMPTKVYYAANAEGQQEPKRFAQAIFANDRNKQNLFNNIVLDAYSKQLTVKRDNERSQMPAAEQAENRYYGNAPDNGAYDSQDESQGSSQTTSRGRR